MILVLARSDQTDLAQVGEAIGIAKSGDFNDCVRGTVVTRGGIVEGDELACSIAESGGTVGQEHIAVQECADG